jgi:hypothetical protein
VTVQTKTETMTLKFHYDAGHGWLAVTPEQVAQVGLTTTDFTTYSYVARDMTGTLYLEEDVDAPRFVNAAKNKGVEIVLNSVYDGDYSYIRNFHRLTP